MKLRLRFLLALPRGSPPALPGSCGVRPDRDEADDAHGSVVVAVGPVRQPRGRTVREGQLSAGRDRLLDRVELGAAGIVGPGTELLLPHPSALDEKAQV